MAIRTLPSRKELLRMRRLFRRCRGFLGQYPVRRIDEALRCLDCNPERAFECYELARRYEPYARVELGLD
ncbi:MAG TPA: hypothetical protein ENJ38_01650 [Rhodospirillales bacterium]|nr:hypothetical protein [Rhodospirillales bacterium]